MRRMITACAAAALLLAACGDDGGAPESAPLTAAATTAAPGTTGTAPAVVPIETPACDLLTAAEVEAATGYAVTEVTEMPPIGCAYALDGTGGVAIHVGVEDGMGRIAGAANLYEEYGLLVETGEAAPVAGVGEGAYCCPFRAIAVDAGAGRFISVAVSGGYQVLAEPLDVLTELARAALARL